MNATTAVSALLNSLSLSLSFSPPANTFRNKPRDERLQAREFIKGDYALILHRDSFPPCRRAETKGRAGSRSRLSFALETRKGARNVRTVETGQRGGLAVGIDRINLSKFWRRTSLIRSKGIRVGVDGRKLGVTRVDLGTLPSKRLGSSRGGRLISKD